MNDLPFPRRFPWLPALAILAFSGSLVLCNWLVWTPIERYYLGTYLKCALFGTDAARGTEVQWLYKTAPHNNRNWLWTPTWFRRLRATTMEFRWSFRRRRGRPVGPAWYRDRTNGSKPSDSNRFLRRSSMTERASGDCC